MSGICLAFGTSVRCGASTASALQEIINSETMISAASLVWMQCEVQAVSCLPDPPLAYV